MSRAGILAPAFRGGLVVLREIVRRILGLPEFAAFFCGVRPTRTLRLQVLILRDPETGRPVVAPDVVRDWVASAEEIIATHARIRLEAAVVEAPAPDDALDIAAGIRAYFAPPSRALASLHHALDEARPLLHTALGRGKPVAVTVTRSINGGLHSGFAYAIDRMVLLSAEANGNSLAHELGHLCWLIHHRSGDNIMNGTQSDTKSGLNALQSAWMRCSSFIA